jgi:hypothetical protein
MRFKLVPFVGALMASAIFASSAAAVPGDDAISNPAPGEFRLTAGTLEPACFDLGRLLSGATGLDASSFDADFLPNEELRLWNLSHLLPLSVDIDQVLVPSEIGGYRVYNQFDVGNNENANSITPGDVGSEMFAPDANGNGNSDLIEEDDVILCLSDENTASQNEPYNQEDGGLVSAKNRPIIQPTITGVGVSAVEPLNTYKVQFGYNVEQWYEAPSFDGFALVPTVTDPQADDSPTFGGDLPSDVDIDNRSDGPYDARRVNDVVTPSESFLGPFFHGQTEEYDQVGDATAWLLDDFTNGVGEVTLITQGDFPLSHTLRPSLAAPSSERTVEMTRADLAAWEQSWQDYYDGKGPLPSLDLPPGTNAPAPDDEVNITLPPAVVNVVPPPVSNTATTTNTTVNAACVSNRKVRMRLAKKARKGTIQVEGQNRKKAKRSDGRLRAVANLKGMEGPGRVTVTIREFYNGKWHVRTKSFKLC